MKYYKDIQGNVFAYALDGSQDYLIGDKVKMTDKEVQLHLNPQKTQEQLNIEASELRDEAMLKGFVYNGMDISVTKDDGDGMVQVKDSFEYDPTPTVIYFKNGTRLPMTIEEFAVFAPIFRSERKKFFS